MIQKRPYFSTSRAPFLLLLHPRSWPLGLWFRRRRLGSDSELRFSSYGVHKIAASVFQKTLNSFQKLSFHAHCLSPICNKGHTAGHRGVTQRLPTVIEILFFFFSFWSFGNGLKGYPYEKQQPKKTLYFPFTASSIGYLWHLFFFSVAALVVVSSSRRNENFRKFSTFSSIPEVSSSLWSCSELIRFLYICPNYQAGKLISILLISSLSLTFGTENQEVKAPRWEGIGFAIIIHCWRPIMDFFGTLNLIIRS